MKVIVRLIIIPILLFVVYLPIHPSDTLTSTAKEGERDTIVFVGNSITNDEYPGAGHYTEYLAQMDRWNDLQFVVQGINGANVGTYYERPTAVESKITNHTPSYVLIFLSYSSLDVDRFETQYNWFIDEILEQNDNITLFLILHSYIEGNEFLDLTPYHEVVTKIGEEHDFPVCDLYTPTYRKYDYFIDHAHPNNEGARVMAEHLNQSFFEYLPVSVPDSHSQVDDTSDDQTIPTEPKEVAETTSLSLEFVFLIPIVLSVTARKKCLR